MFPYKVIVIRTFMKKNFTCRISHRKRHVVRRKCDLLLAILFHLQESEAVLIKDSVQTNCFIKGMIQWYQETNGR